MATGLICPIEAEVDQTEVDQAVVERLLLNVVTSSAPHHVHSPCNSALLGQGLATGLDDDQPAPSAEVER